MVLRTLTLLISWPRQFCRIGRGKKLSTYRLLTTSQGKFFLLYPKTHSFGSFGPFSEAKVKFWGSKLLVKAKKKCVFNLNQIFKIVHPQVPTKVCMRCAKSKNHGLVIFWRFLNFRTIFWAVYRYQMEKRTSKKNCAWYWSYVLSLVKKKS